MSVPVSELLSAIIRLCERACKLAQWIRYKPELFKLLIEEKSDGAANKRFVQDFKTLADVLIQEMVRYDIGLKFPGLMKSVYGEEEAEFVNPLKADEHISVAIDGDRQSLIERLTKVLAGDSEAAEMLTDAVLDDKTAHDDLKLPMEQMELLECEQIDSGSLGIWIDPIDGTNVYISANVGAIEDAGPIAIKSLQCVTVLIGVFLKTESHTTAAVGNGGRPILGVVGRPFVDGDDCSVWNSSSLWWGYCSPQLRVCSLPKDHILHDNRSTFTILHSSSDNSHPIVVHLKTQADGRVERVQLLSPAGAGYKLLCVAVGAADIYMCTTQNVYQWDTCAPHALLSSLPEEGGIVSYSWFRDHVEEISRVYERDSVAGDTVGGTLEDRLKNNQLPYSEKTSGSDASEFANNDGLVAYRSPVGLARFAQLVSGFCAQE